MNKNSHGKKYSKMEFGAVQNEQPVFIRVFGDRAVVITFMVCATLLLGGGGILSFCLRLASDPSYAPLVNIINGNGNNNDGSSYSDNSTTAPEQPRETEQLRETEQSKEIEQLWETEQSEGRGETRYRVVAHSYLRLRENPNTESAILMNLPYEREVISEGNADERGWMPVRVELSYGILRGYVFAAYLVPVV